MHSSLFLALFIFYGQSTYGKSTGSSQTEVEVKEIWRNNELIFSWDSDYFRQFFKPGAPIVIQVNAYISETNDEDAVFIPSVIGIIRGANDGTAKISISNENKDRITKFSHYYVLKPVATQSAVYLSSGVVGPTHDRAGKSEF